MSEVPNLCISLHARAIPHLFCPPNLPLLLCTLRSRDLLRLGDTQPLADPAVKSEDTISEREPDGSASALDRCIDAATLCATGWAGRARRLRKLVPDLILRRAKMRTEDELSADTSRR